MQNRYLTGMICMLLFLVQNGIFSETVIDVETAVSSALECNLNLRSEEIGLRIKKRVKDTMWNYFIPKVSVSTTLSKMNQVAEPMVFDLGPMGIFEMPGGDDYWDLTLGLNASLTLTASMFVGMKQAVLDYEAGNISLEMAQKKMALNVRKTFYNLLLIEENMKLMERSIAAAEDRYLQAVANYRSGLVPEYAMLSAQVAWENMKPALEEMKIGYRSAMMGFKQMLGIDRGEEIVLEGTIHMEEVPFTGENTLQRINERLDIRLFKKNIEMLENLKLLSVTSLAPAITFSFTADPGFQGDPFASNLFANIEDNWNQRAGMFAIILSIPVDGLFPSSKTQVEIANSADAVEQSKNGLKIAFLAAQLEIDTILMKLEKSVKSIDTLKLNVALAERAYNMAEEAYNAGSKDLLELQNAELELRKARLEVLKEEYNYMTGLLDLEYALNVEFEKAGK
jgi:outer membrane protein TolC